MEKEKFKLKLHLKSGIKEVDEYLQEIHDHYQSFNTSSIKQLIVALDSISSVLTEDIYKISNGETEGLKILADNLNDKLFDRVLKLVDKIECFNKVSELSKSLIPEIEEIKSTLKSEKIKIDSKGNPMEQIINKLGNKK